MMQCFSFFFFSDIDPLQFSLSLGNLGETFSSQPFANCDYVVDEQSSGEEDKLQLQHMLAISQQQPLLQQHQQHQQPQQIAAPILGKDEFAGDYNFQLILNHHQNNGKHWVVSISLCHKNVLNYLKYF